MYLTQACELRMFLAYETQAPDSGVENEQRVNGQANTILDDPAAAEDTDARGEGPENEDDIYRDARYPDQVEGGEERGDDEWK